MYRFAKYIYYDMYNRRPIVFVLSPRAHLSRITTHGFTAEHCHLQTIHIFGGIELDTKFSHMQSGRTRASEHEIIVKRDSVVYTDSYHSLPS